MFQRLTFKDFKLYTPELNSLKDLIRELEAIPNRCTYTVPLFDQFDEKALNNLMPEYLVPKIEYSANLSWTRKIQITQHLLTCQALRLLTRIGIRGTTPHTLRRPKEGSAMTRPTIQKIPDDHGVLPKAQIIIYTKIYVN
jgi:hypothetical protein